MGVSGPGHSSVMRRAATIDGHSCRVVGRGGVDPLRFWGGFPLLGAQRDHPHPSVRGDPPGPLGPFGEAIHRPTKALVAAADGEQRVQGFGFPLAPDVGVVRVVPPGREIHFFLLPWGQVCPQLGSLTGPDPWGSTFPYRVYHTPNCATYVCMCLTSLPGVASGDWASLTSDRRS